MARRTKAQWRDIIKQQKSSGLIAAEFCRQHSINAKYFSLQKQRLSDDKAAFVKVMPSTKKSPLISTDLIKLRVIEFSVPLESADAFITMLLRSS